MNDVFGKIMRDAFEGKPSEHLVERDDGYGSESTGQQYVAEFDEWHESERLGIAKVKGKVLDVGCGAGRVALFLQQKGHEVVGIDISEEALEVARERGVRDARYMSVGELDFPDGTFDTVLMYGNNFGLLGEYGKVVQMLRDLHRITSDDSVILAATRDPEDTDEPAHLEIHAKNKAAGKPPGLVRIRMKYGDMISGWWDLLMVSPEMLAEMAESSGWKFVEYLGPRNYYVGVLKKR
ncbi:MAG: methyltransferase domain-containing protein [Candidatus Thorarchaeota archaeon]